MGSHSPAAASGQRPSGPRQGDASCSVAPPMSTAGRDGGPSVRPSLQAGFRCSKPKFVTHFWPVWETAAQGGGADRCEGLFYTRSPTLYRSVGASTLQQKANGGWEGSSAGHAGTATGAASCSAGHGACPLCRRGPHWSLTDASWARHLPPPGSSSPGQSWGSGAVAL